MSGQSPTEGQPEQGQGAPPQTDKSSVDIHRTQIAAVLESMKTVDRQYGRKQNEAFPQPNAKSLGRKSPSSVRTSPAAVKSSECAMQQLDPLQLSSLPQKPQMLSSSPATPLAEQLQHAHCAQHPAQVVQAVHAHLGAASAATDATQPGQVRSGADIVLKCLTAWVVLQR